MRYVIIMREDQRAATIIARTEKALVFNAEAITRACEENGSAAEYGNRTALQDMLDQRETDMRAMGVGVDRPDAWAQALTVALAYCDLPGVYQLEARTLADGYILRPSRRKESAVEASEGTAEGQEATT